MKNTMNKLKSISSKELYKRCLPHMMAKFGRILSYEEFCATLQYAAKHNIASASDPFTAG